MPPDFGTRRLHPGNIYFPCCVLTIDDCQLIWSNLFQLEYDFEIYQRTALLKMTVDYPKLEKFVCRHLALTSDDLLDDEMSAGKSLIGMSVSYARRYFERALILFSSFF